MGDYDHIRCYVVLNITQGFGNIVLNNIHDANIPALIDSKLEGHGKVIHSEEKWDSGILTHDLHLYYELNINCYRLIKKEKQSRGKNAKMDRNAKIDYQKCFRRINRRRFHAKTKR